MNPRRQRVTDTQHKPCTGNNPGGASQILTQPVEQTTNRRAPEQATTRDNTFAQSQVAHQTKSLNINSTPAGTLKQRREEHIDTAKGRGATATDKAAETPNRPRPH